MAVNIDCFLVFFVQRTLSSVVNTIVLSLCPAHIHTHQLNNVTIYLEISAIETKSNCFCCCCGCVCCMAFALIVMLVVDVFIIFYMKIVLYHKSCHGRRLLAVVFLYSAVNVFSPHTMFACCHSHCPFLSLVNICLCLLN